MQSLLLVFVMVMLPSLCSSACGRKRTPVTCDCLDACSAYTGKTYKDCAQFCSYNTEPLPRCMCEEAYKQAENRQVRAFQVTGNEVSRPTSGTCKVACEPTNDGSGAKFSWTGSDCYCRCPQFNELMGYGLQ